ncbi:MAG: M36 family metallopeptidase [Pseudomonadota bacterium]|nr:M36 family metallopeptidase [Pseudomonadota bacterium]
MQSIIRNAALTVSIAAALSSTGAAFARDLGNFDVNVVTSKQSTLATQPKNAMTTFLRQSTDIRQSNHVLRTTDALGRAAFTWVQQDLPVAAQAKAGDPEAVARAHLAHMLGAAKHAGDAAQTLTLRKIDQQRGGANLVQFQARLDGIAIFREDLALLMDGNQRLVAMRGPLPQTGVAAAKALPKFKLDAPQAIAAALRAYDFTSAIAARLQAGAHKGEYQHFKLGRDEHSKSGAQVEGELRAKRVYYRTHAGLQPAWYVETQVADAREKSTDGYGHVISAVDGSVLFRINQSAHATSYSYRVWAENSSDRLPHPSPQGRNATPDPDGLPTNNIVPFIAQELRSLANAPFSHSDTDGWLSPGSIVTNGNNVQAFADLVTPNGLNAGDMQPTITSVNSFDYLYNTDLAPDANSTQTQAATVQLFYWVNWLHDWFYDHGFAEADGNAQTDNFGRGGIGGDPLLAQAQDFALDNNANMYTPSDGESPQMQMGIWDSSPARDSTLDGATVSHEWGHYLSNRLVFDSNGLDTTHAGGLGEGWSDFVALLTHVKEEDRLKPTNAAFSGAYGSSGYASNQTYFGVRRFPYSTDLSKNPLSLSHIVDGTTLPSGVFTDNTEVHNQGEIWASALWDSYVGMLNDTSRLSFLQAQNRMKDYLVGGLKLTPASPTMVEARDAILATILASGETADFALFTAGFAKRGLGAGAFIPDRYSETMIGTVESKLTGSDIAVASASIGVPSGCDADSILDLGETAQLRISLDNSGFAPLASASATLSSNNPALTFPSGNKLTLGAIPLFGTTSGSIPVRLSSSVAPNTPIIVTVTPDASGINSPPGITGSVRMFVNFDQTSRTSTVETFDEQQSGWVGVRQPAGTGTGTWSQQIEGAVQFWHGSDQNSRAVTWTQSPVMSVGGGPLTVTLNHRHAFETDATTFYDGGVIQASIDGGSTWSNIDATAAGYSVSSLSDCCGNPLAGQRAYLSNSAAYPLFVERVINLGTTYVNQANFRLRFGVATDAASNVHGWDINTVTITGLNNTPFNAVVPQASGCSVASGKTLQGAMSGTYYSTSRSGEGVLVDFGQVGGTPVVFFTWYTYGTGTQQWLVGSNTFAATDTSVVVDLINTSGASFGSAFRPEDVARTPWGSVALSFPDCDNMTLTYQQANGEAGTQTLTRVLGRLDAGQCNLLQGGLSGTYYSTSRSGEGVLVDFGRVGETPIEFFTWYTYGAGTQQWLVGSQSFAASDSTVTVDLVNTNGASFGNAFRPQDVVRSPWGRVTQRFIDCNTLELNYQKTGGESGTQVLTRALGRLGDGQCH